ncbi:E3 ubiquitin ligase family protein [Chitiniphilus purpureus]|uniref:E3 ubiquitin ligase family protein n=1 Tax=Chitiniphilus purpureus TaxID=2981137 RepID=A0ABY6DP63_9NEIS|nr:E3 ubiquitin ligase family protein [Chitiniphilus sp. CD1]UXY14886.1 E3 ubiquitin ligase family protein [Chitiniphilus sp. CD1]
MLHAVMRLSRQDWARWHAVAGALALLTVAWFSHSRTVWQTCLGLLALLCLASWHTTRRRYLAIANTPEANIGSASQGYARLGGRAQPLDGVPLVSPLGNACVWYRCVTEATRSSNRWETVEVLESEYSFLLDDGSGSCIVDPDGALLDPGEPHEVHSPELRRREWWIFPGQPLEALGEFATQHTDRSAGAQRASIAGRLADWKHDRRALLSRFDRDGNGEIDLQEWEHARLAAQTEIQRETINSAERQRAHLLRRPPHGAPFLITTNGLDRLAQRHRHWSWFHLTAAILALHAIWLLQRHPQWLPM